MHSWHKNQSSKSGQTHSSGNKKYSGYKPSYHRSNDERSRSSRTDPKKDRSEKSHGRRNDDIVEKLLVKNQQDLLQMEKYLKSSKSDLHQQSEQETFAQERSSQHKESVVSKGFSRSASNQIKPVGTIPPPNKSKGSSTTESRSMVSPALENAARYTYPDERRVKLRENVNSNAAQRTSEAAEVGHHETVMIRSEKLPTFNQAYDDRLEGSLLSSGSVNSLLPYHGSTNFSSHSEQKYDLLSSTHNQGLEVQKEDETSYSWVGELLDDETNDYATNKSSKAQELEHQRSDNVFAKKERRHSRKSSYDAENLAYSDYQSKSNAKTHDFSTKFEHDSRYSSHVTTSVLDKQNHATTEHQRPLKHMPKTSSNRDQNNNLNSSKQQFLRYHRENATKESPTNSPYIKRSKTSDYHKTFSEEKIDYRRASEAAFSSNEGKEHSVHGTDLGSVEHVSYKKPFPEEIPVRHQFVKSSDSRTLSSYHDNENVNAVSRDKYFKRDTRQFDRAHSDRMQTEDHFLTNRNTFKAEYGTKFAKESQSIDERNTTHEFDRNFHKNSKTLHEKLCDDKGKHNFLFEGRKFSHDDRIKDSKEEDAYSHRRFEKRKIVDHHGQFSVRNEKEHKYFHRDQFDKVKSYKDESNAFKQHVSSDSSHSTHKNVDKVSVSDFSGAWEAATNTSINVKNNPKLYEHNAKKLAFALHAVKAPVKYSSKHQAKQHASGDVHGKTAVSASTNQLSDKREVVRKSNQSSLDMYDPFELTKDQTHESLGASNNAFTKQTFDSRNVKRQSLSRSINSFSNDGSITIRKQIPPNEREFWEKDFVDWFSKHILPTQAFKVYMECVCPKMTSSDLAAMPMDFLEHLQDGDRLAISCIPKDKYESRQLFLFLGKFRELINVAQEEYTEIIPKSHHSLAKKDHMGDDRLSSQHHATPPLAINDTNIPVLISNKSLPDKVVSHSVLQIRNVEDDPSVLPLASKQNVHNLIITCSNPEPVTGLSQEPSVQSLSRTVVNRVYQPITQAGMHDPSTSLFAETSIVDSGVGSTAFGKSDLVNPRWNAEVQEFIGRAQSGNSRPSYIEYLEKSGLDVKDSDDSSGNSHRRKPPPHQRRSFSPRDNSLVRKRRRSHDRTSRPRQFYDHFTGRSRSPCRDIKRKHETDSPASRQTTGSSDRRTTFYSRTKAKGRSPIKAGPTKETRSSNDDKSLKASSSKKSLRLSQSSEIQKLSSSKKETLRRTNSSTARNPNQTNNFKVFGASKKCPIHLEQETIKELEKSSRKSELSSYRRYLKNFAAQQLNLMYAMQHYDSRKIDHVIYQSRLHFAKLDRRNTCCSKEEAIFILKDIFLENSKSNIQVNLKRKLSERGKDWAVTSFGAFQRFQKEVFENCSKKLSSSKPFKEQDSGAVRDITKQLEQLYPQFCGDVNGLVRMWLWQCCLMKHDYKTEEKSFSHLEGWEALYGTKNTIDRFLLKQFNFPVYDNTDRKCQTIISAMKSKLKSTVEEAVSHILEWWMNGYYKCRYESFEREMKTTISKTSKTDDTARDDEAKRSENDSKREKLSEERVIVVDEIKEEGGEKTEIFPESFGDSTDPTLLEDPLNQEDAVNEYAEDEGGCPTILLF